MPAQSDIERLRGIKRLDQLVAYLRDELDWPIASDDIEDISYTYEPEELGLEAEHAVKINQIKQLRPLHSGQPWGIFWVSFEKKRLPVVVLRRILASLVVKSRQSANSADRPRWKMNDLLFISAYGDEDTAQREIAFAHFKQTDGDLPTLRVLGWDGADTPLKLDHVAHTLAQTLHWPSNTADAEAWREQWSSAFRHRIGHVIRTADGLAERLASLARAIRGAAQTMMALESERGQLTKLYKAFQTALIHDLTPETFADTYAQTVTYGLLTAAISRTEMSAGTAGTYIQAQDVADIVPVTNPFLKEMLQTFLKAGGRRGGIDFDELGIQDVVELLRGEETDLPEVLRDFGNKNPDEDPVIRFYEDFLKAYDAQLRIKRGVFYTPWQVVSYIVRSVHELLQTEFGLADGLASTVTWGEMVKQNPSLKLPHLTDEPGEKRTIDPAEPFVQILDIATGTATFIVEVIDVVHQTMTAKWRKAGLTAAQVLAAWNDYVPKHLLPRVYGFELMMAPYAIAHMKVGLKLYETGYRFGTTERVRIYLTNSLEPKVRQLPQIGFEALAHEAAAVNEIKWYKRFTVAIGNPPYSGLSANMTEDAQRLVEAYKTVDGAPLNERKLWLQDDYVKFMRSAQIAIEQTRVGVLGLITNHGYLNNPTFRGMRRSLMHAFNDIRVLDLHGNANIKEAAPDGSKDENVFDIMQGVAVGLMIKRKDEPGKIPAGVFHCELWGSRASKYVSLLRNQQALRKWATLQPNSPHYFFVPRNESLRGEYESGWPLPKTMPVNGVGMVTARDALTIAFDSDALWRRVNQFSKVAADEARTEYNLGEDAQSWKVSWAQEDVRQSGPSKTLIHPVLYRPFDRRFTYYTGQSSGFICRPVFENMRHMLAGRNLSIDTCRQIVSDSWRHVLATDGLTDDCFVSNKSRERGYLFPVYLYSSSEVGTGQLFKEGTDQGAGKHSRRPNLSSSFVTDLGGKLGLAFVPDGEGDLKGSFGPEDIFHYAYAVFHSPGYRSRYAEFLKIDFPRLPLTSDLDLFRALAKLGGALVALHLLDSPKLDKPITEFIGGRNPEVEKVSWSKNTVWLDKAQTTGVKGVREDVWNFHIGGYQVCEKWLKDRKGRQLCADDLTHYQKIVVALSETIRLMAEIDTVIEKHGGWPAAFAGRSTLGHFQQRARAWVAKQLGNGGWGTICDRVCEVLEGETGEFCLPQISESAKAVGAKEDDVHTVLTCLCSGKAPLLAQMFYWQHGPDRIVVPPDEVSSFLAKRESDEQGWNKWASGVQVVWVRADQTGKTQ